RADLVRHADAARAARPGLRAGELPAPAWRRQHHRGRDRIRLRARQSALREARRGALAHCALSLPEQLGLSRPAAACFDGRKDAHAGAGLARCSTTARLREDIMIRTPLCDLLDIEHPIALGGMGSASSPAMTAAVSRAGGLGAMGCHYLTPQQIQERVA